MEENVLRREILLQGYYGIGNWLRKVRFEEELSRDHLVRDDIDKMADYCYSLLASMLLRVKNLPLNISCCHNCVRG